MEAGLEVVPIATNNIELGVKSPLLSQIRSIENVLYMSNKELDDFLEKAVRTLPSGIYPIRKMRRRICRKNFPDYDPDDSLISRKIGVNLRFVLSKMIDRGEVKIYSSVARKGNFSYIINIKTNEYLSRNRDIEMH